MTISILSTYDIYIRHICAVPQVPVAAYFSAAPPSLSSATVAAAKAAHFILAFSSRWGARLQVSTNQPVMDSLPETQSLRLGKPCRVDGIVVRLWIVMEGDNPSLKLTDLSHLNMDGKGR